MFYGANVDGKLFMGQSTLAVLPAFLSDVYDEVPLTGSVGIPENTLNTKFFNVTNDGNRRSLGGTKGDKTSEGNVVIDSASTVHANMEADSDVSGGRKRNWHILYPTGKRKYFVGFLSRWAEAPFDAGEEAVEHRADYTITIDGPITTVNP